MKNLQIHNSNFITFKNPILTVDILGGVDLQMIERMVCTLRITHQNFPPFRTTLDLYNDNQTDKLIRSLCDKWELKLLEVSEILHGLILELETYRLEELKYTGKNTKKEFILTENDRKEALKLLKSKDLVKKLTQNLNTTGIIGEDENAIILFMALSSFKFSNPFSVLCLAKSGIGKSYILQKLSECMPVGSYSFHTQISANALYYFNSHEIQNKALLIEDLEWTTQMLTPLSTLQSQGKLVKTRATKNKDGMMHSTTFEVTGNLCLLACAYSDKNYESLSLPFLLVHLNHSQSQDIAIMNYQKQIKAGLIKLEEVKEVQHRLKCLIASLENVSIINPFAPFINLPEDVAHPRKSLLLLLNFIEVITCFFQHQREQVINEETGEVFIKTAPEDIKLAFQLLKNSLFRRADELSTSARGFYNWLSKYLKEAQCAQFTALDIRKSKAIHPRTLNRYLQELNLYSYIQIAGGNKHREGFIYKITQFGNQTDAQNRIEKALQETLKSIDKENNKQNGKPQNKEESEKVEPKQQEPEPEKKQEQEKETTKKSKRVRITENYKHTLKLLLELEEKEPKRTYKAEDFEKLTGRSYGLEASYLKTLWEKQILERDFIDSQFIYRLSENYDPRTKPSQIQKAPERAKKRNRIKEKEKYTLKLILKLEEKEQGREYHPSDFTAITGRSKITEARHLKTLWEQNKLNREWKDRQYFYKLATTSSKTVSQTPMSNPQTQQA